MPQQHLFYLHGYMSSERSQKGMLTEAYLAQNFPEIIMHRPRLDDEPARAMAALSDVLERLVSQQEQVALIGSSLGGFYAHYLAERLAIPAVLINPAVAPYRLLANFLGEQTNPYTGRTLVLTETHMDELKALESPVSQPQLIQLWIESADEVLEPQLALDYFAKCDCRVRPGGDHRYQNFEADCPAMVEFLRTYWSSVSSHA